MRKTVLKDIFREMKSSFGRFFAIFAIVAIGVSFFAGVTASSGDMKHSSDQYYDEYQLMDLRLVSSIGFDEEDIEAIRAVEGIEGLFATHTADAVTTREGVQSAVRIMTVPDYDRTEENVNYINRPRLKEGRLPENDSECVIKYESTRSDLYGVGDTITLSSGNDADIEETLKEKTLTVVGVVYTPYYLTYDMGQTDVGNGKIAFCILVQDSAFRQEYYTEVFATIAGAKALDTYSDAYFDRVDETAQRLKNISAGRLSGRADQIQKRLAAEKQNALEEVYAGIREAVRSQLYEQYALYYPGADIAAMVEPMVDEVARANMASYDTSEIDASFDRLKEEALDAQSDWQWYVLDRNSHYSFRDYKASAERMEAIAAVFPLFFIFVAALVCLTTMTRMVDEQRELIGVYKALGYSKAVIAMKYVLYSLTASLTGGILGCVVGLKMFPSIIYHSWNILYEMPPIVYAGHFWLSVLAIASMVLVILISTVYACYSELVEVPSQLMRPKPPKKGKKILLEHIGFFWRRLSFSGKVTARNIFRYKKRFFMTVIGVAGGSALMMTGFGIKDSISGLIRKQYQEIFRYDVSLLYDRPEIQEAVEADVRFERSTSVYSFTTSVALTEAASQREEPAQDNVSVEVVSDSGAYQDYVTLRKRNTSETYQLADTGVCMTEKLARDLSVKAGDTIYIENKNGVCKPVKVDHIVEMYTNHYIFITAGYYEEVFGESVQNNCILGILKDTAESAQTAIGSDYLNQDGVAGITFFTANIEKFNSMIESLNLVTYVLILSAAALSFVVLYNLTNVNVSERIREIATIKVLGFFDMEVALYVYRENLMITVIGAAAGLLLGLGLHSFIMRTVEMDNLMFGNEVHGLSLVLAFALTVLFSLIVNVVMYRRLKKIPMVESLKSVE